MAVAEVQPPHLHRLVGRAGRQEGPVVRDIHGHDWQLVAVQGQEKLEGVVVEDLDRAVENGHFRKQLRNIHTRREYKQTSVREGRCSVSMRVILIQTTYIKR